MDWQLIGIIAISAGALLAYFALGKSGKPQQPAEDRKIQGLDVLKPAPARVDEEATRRLLEALKVQS